LADIHQLFITQLGSLMNARVI